MIWTTLGRRAKAGWALVGATVLGLVSGGAAVITTPVHQQAFVSYAAPQAFMSYGREPAVLVSYGEQGTFTSYAAQPAVMSSFGGGPQVFASWSAVA